jgi:hypothetical protein
MDINTDQIQAERQKIMRTYDEIMSISIERVEEFIQSYGVKYSIDELLKLTGLYLNHIQNKNQLRIIGDKDKKKIQVFGFKKVTNEHLERYKEDTKAFLKHLEIIRMLRTIRENFENLN